ncbi:MAG TPA: vWA domain-containing protein [Blastocatellia bacterium]|nr:vWA domain-containing protein [Blastocatellia bacterium]
MSLPKSLLAFGLGLAALVCLNCRTEKQPDAQLSPSEVVLKEARKIELRYLKEGDPRAFFHADLQFINGADGTPAKVKLQENLETLRSKITIREGKRVFQPFYVFPPETSAGGGSRRDLVMLFDTSGSMAAADLAPDRFKAAKGAAKELLRTLRSGDQIAVAPFNNRNVRAQIEDAPFQTASASQIDNLPAPGGDTALYSAIDFALDKLKGRRDADPARLPVLIVLTDGRNDVGHPGEEPGLIADDGFNRLMAKIAELNIQVFTIGVGRAGRDFDEEKLRALTYPRDRKQYFPAADEEGLRRALGDVQELSSNQLRFAFFPGYLDYKQLKSLNFQIEYETQDKRKIRGVIPWDCGAAAGCAARGALLPEEITAALRVPIQNQVDDWKKILWLFGKFALFSGGIAALWFLIPRIVWPVPSLPQMRDQVKKPVPPRPSPNLRTPPPERELPNSRAKPRHRFEETQVYDDRRQPGDSRNRGNR